MLRNFADELMDEGRRKNSVLVVGLDPDEQYFPDCVLDKADRSSSESMAEAIVEFNQMVIDAVADHAIAVKPQLAYYEVYGSYGIRALERTIAYARSKQLIVLHDAKRGDIGPTSTAYARAFLGDSPLSGDMVTVNPFLGSDGYLPFVEMAKQNQKGVFLLLKTSNPSSHEIQDLILENGERLYWKMAGDIQRLAQETVGLQGYSFIGAVVGATYPDEAKKLRKALPYSYFLVPGFGQQGGEAEDLQAFFDANGNGAVISSSRGIIYSYMNEAENWKTLSLERVSSSIAAAAQLAKEQINQVRFRN